MKVVSAVSPGVEDDGGEVVRLATEIHKNIVNLYFKRRSQKRAIISMFNNKL